MVRCVPSVSAGTSYYPLGTYSRYAWSGENIFSIISWRLRGKTALIVSKGGAVVPCTEGERTASVDTIQSRLCINSALKSLPSAYVGYGGARNKRSPDGCCGSDPSRFAITGSPLLLVNIGRPSDVYIPDAV
jgi:hypothetical protein